LPDSCPVGFTSVMGLYSRNAMLLLSGIRGTARSWRLAEHRCRRVSAPCHRRRGRSTG